MIDMDTAPVSTTLANTEGLTSVHCTLGHPGKPLIQYALMVDAGSTGSRIHVYRFNHCKESPELEDEIFLPTKPGLSSYPDDPEEAAKSLDILMDLALKSVPVSLHKCTPVAVKATAGLRLLGQVKSERILKAVRHRFETVYPFPLVARDGVVIMDGKDEGVYAWITVNYLLGNLKGSTKHPTAAIFDLGGGSTQIVFEPSFIDGDQLAEGEHKYQLKYGDHTYMLYQHSYLGYGLMEARKQIKEYMWKLHREGSDVDTSDKIAHPCFPQNYSEPWSALGESAHSPVELYGTAAGHAQCRTITEHILNKNKECLLTPCSFDGAYQPSLATTFDEHDIYAFSYFYDRTQPLGMPSEFSIKDLRILTDRVCSAEVDKFEHVPGALEELAADPTYCMDLSFIYGLLHYGYEIPEDRMVKIAKKINDVETGWCLGAAIAVLDEVSWCEE
ncbi:nucleoside phosphatase GDA1/CD39 [Jimgerdemannia flammicorona]|uniref:guanosine-diphosphatase n=1 Tax=Jimgerdemannia flammicorona TaxID=994334 RepID=A0A433Q2W7_9FUNG|nr:nucleoside phosphatase GDA1/CD39 [Jimgerdemannia flammicorona]